MKTRKTKDVQCKRCGAIHRIPKECRLNASKVIGAGGKWGRWVHSCKDGGSGQWILVKP